MFEKYYFNYYKNLIFKKINEKGLRYVLWGIIKRLISIKFIIIYPLVFILCLIIKIIKPLFFIRFGSLNAAKIGPFVMITEMGLCEQENGIQPDRKKTLNIYHKGNVRHVCNKQLLKMWGRILKIYPKSRYFYNVMSSFRFGRSHTIGVTQEGRDMFGLLEKTTPHISFIKSEVVQAKKELLKMGICDQDKYVLIINRGKKYTEKTFSHIDMNYNNFRNCSIDNYLLMAENLTKKGYTVVRVGQLTDEVLKTTNPKIIDYDRRGYRTDLLDIYLAANCKYIVGSDTGYMHVPGYLFRKPTVHVNFSQFERLLPHLKSWLFIFKKYWLKNEKRFMRVEEIIKSKVGRFDTHQDFKKKGIELIENTSEEISEVVNEMEKKLNGKIEYSEEDNDLQNYFWSHFESSNLFGIPKGRIGQKFLRDNKDLFIK